MNFVNPPAESRMAKSNRLYITFTGGRDESSEIWPLEKVYKSRRAITVFVNAIPSEDGTEQM